MSTQKAPIKNLPKGEYVRLSEKGPVWVKGGFSPSSRAYTLTRFDDMCHSIERKGTVLVFHGFTF